MLTVFTANHSHTMQLMSGANCSYNPLCGWNYSTGPFSDSSIVSNMGAMDLLDTRESILSFPCTLSNLLRDRPALLMISRQSLHSLSAQVTPRWYTQIQYMHLHTRKHHPCGPKDYSHVTISTAVSSSTRTFNSQMIEWITSFNGLWSMARSSVHFCLFSLTEAVIKKVCFLSLPLLLWRTLTLGFCLCSLSLFVSFCISPAPWIVSIGLKGEIINVLHTSVWDLRNILFVLKCWIVC